MLFNSAGFLYLFLPLSLVAFGAAVRRQWSAIGLLIVASYVFYGWFEPSNLVLLAGSTGLNYLIGEQIIAAVHRGSRQMSRLLLGIGVTADLSILGYFKYAGFVVTNIHSLTGADLPFANIVLPIGISFYTFTQIAFLVDAARGEVQSINLHEYFLFVSYLPHLVAGPIIHHSEMMPQFRRLRSPRWDVDAVAMGLSIFAIGMFKKLAIADNVAPIADLTFGQAGTHALTMIEGWTGAIAYAFQIYFDFSGYSDMAVGLSLLFGIRLPMNFNSPYRATSIIDFWKRWHMSLSRFLRDYLYIPLGGNRRGVFRRYVNLMTVMLLGGLWHGAAWTFVIWGGLHGLYLCVNHLIRISMPRPRAAQPSTAVIWAKRCVVCILVTIAWVFFRADSVESAFKILVAMTGAQGIGTFREQANAVSLLLLCSSIVWLAPNTYAVFAAHNPVLTTHQDLEGPRAWLQWRPNRYWAMVSACIFAGTVLAVSHASPFLYFRF